MMDQNLLERVNPVFNTAKMTVFQLAAAGEQDAVRVAEKLNLSFEETQNSVSTTVSPEQMTSNVILVETRWRTCAAIAEKTGCKTVVDLPCGYTPRAKAMSQKGIAYYGLDLPAAISEAEPAILSLIDEDKRSSVHFCGDQRRIPESSAQRRRGTCVYHDRRTADVFHRLRGRRAVR